VHVPVLCTELLVQPSHQGAFAGITNFEAWQRNSITITVGASTTSLTMTQRSLATSAIECARLFNDLSSQLLDRERETRTTLSQPSTEDEGARYKIWAGNLGAFQRLPATSSLDYRLRESPKVATQIQELLEDLQHALQRISAIASGESPNRVAESTDSEDDYDDDSEDDHDKDETEKVSDGSEDGIDEDVIIEVDADEKPHQLSEAGELFRSVKDTITGLFRISIIIRKASPRDRFAKALAARQEPFDDRFDIDYVSNKFPMLNIEKKEWFKERVGKAITQRRQYLRYARDHRDKLAREPKDLWQPEDIGPRTTLLPVPSQASKANLTKPTSTLAPTTASTLLTERLSIDEEDLSDNQSQTSQTSYAVSLGEDDLESHLRLPSLVEVSRDATTFECPFCWTVQDIQRDSVWRKHVFRDLKPYICTFDDCDIKLFSDRREWFEHELSYHRAQWCCGFCGKDDIRSLKVFKDHVRSRHMQGLKNDQLDALSEASRRPIDHIPASDCPFCQEWEAKLRLANPNISADEIVVVTPIQFRQHVGAHMQQLALFSIPRGFLEDDADTKSVTSLGNFQSSIAGLRKVQMTLEFGSLEDALQELQRLHDQTPDDLEVHLLLSNCYHQLGNESAALVHNRRAQDLRVLAQKEDHSDELSDSSTDTSKELDLQVMGTHMENHEADDPDTLTSISQLESVLEEQRKYEEDEAKYEAELGYEHAEAKHKEAEAMYRRVLELREKILGPKHPDTLTSVNQLGLSLQRQRRYDEAALMYQRVLEAGEVLGQEHPDTLTSASSLGLVLEEQGKYEEAEAIYRQVLEVREKVLGREHPDTLTSASSLGLVLGEQGKYKEAEPMYRQVLEAREKVLGREHLDTLTSFSSLGLVLEGQGKFKEAEAMHQQALDGYKRVLGEKHPNTLTSISQLGLVLEKQGKWEEAEALYQQVLEASEREFGKDHPETLTTKSNLASVLNSQGRYLDAELMHQEVIEASKRVFKEENPETLRTKSNLALVLNSRGRYGEAEVMHRQVLEARKRVLGPNHPSTLESMRYLA
jgi:tetratricopeptide (TPR) repeat protein